MSQPDAVFLVSRIGVIFFRVFPFFLFIKRKKRESHYTTFRDERTTQVSTGIYKSIIKHLQMVVHVLVTK
jgi:hypothetical protein